MYVTTWQHLQLIGCNYYCHSTCSKIGSLKVLGTTLTQNLFLQCMCVNDTLLQGTTILMHKHVKNRKCQTKRDCHCEMQIHGNNLLPGWTVQMFYLRLSSIDTTATKLTTCTSKWSWISLILASKVICGQYMYSWTFSTSPFALFWSPWY